MKRKRIIIIALVVVVGLVVLGALIIPRKIERFFYPLAPPMPAVVSKPTTQILAELEAEMQRKAPKVLDQLQKGLSDEEITALERQAGIKLPAEFRALYRWRNGSQSHDFLTCGPVPMNRFVPLGEALGVRAMFNDQGSNGSAVEQAATSIFAGHRKSWITLFDDGAGDGYFFDPKRKPEEGAVFFSFAEDGTYVFFPSLNNLLAASLKCYQTGVFSWTNGPSGSYLNEDPYKSQAIWDEFGAPNVR